VGADRRGRRAPHLLAEDAPHLGAALASADGLLLKPWLGADRALIDAAPGLRYIGMLGTGMGRIDARHASARGIAIRNVAGYSTRGVSEFVLAVVLAHLRDLERARSEVRAGRLSETGFAGSEIAGKTFGVLGLGRIGLAVARLARAFGAEAIYWSRASRRTSPGSGWSTAPSSSPAPTSSPYTWRTRPRPRACSTRRPSPPCGRTRSWSTRRRWTW
jgi:phosphoglycerate dehydrogenase-like enzyme